MPLGHEAAAKVRHHTAEAGGSDDQELEEYLANRDLSYDRSSGGQRLRQSGFAAASLMALGLVPLEAVHHARLGYAEREPILHVLLQRDVELREPASSAFPLRPPCDRT